LTGEPNISVRLKVRSLVVFCSLGKPTSEKRANKGRTHSKKPLKKVTPMSCVDFWCNFTVQKRITLAPRKEGRAFTGEGGLSAFSQLDVKSLTPISQGERREGVLRIMGGDGSRCQGRRISASGGEICCTDQTQ